MAHNRGTPDRIVHTDNGGSSGGNVVVTNTPLPTEEQNLPLPVQVQTPAGDSAMDEGNDAVRVNVVAGGAGGGAATIADGADVNSGSTTDVAETSDSDGTLSGKLRGLVKWAYERMPTSLGQKLMAASFPVTLASDQSAVPVSGTVTIQDGGNVITVDATNLDIRDLTFAQDKVDASGTVLGAGNNNIGDVDVATLPTFGNGQGVQAEDSPHASGDLGVSILGVRNDTNATLSSADGDYTPIKVNPFGEVSSAIGRTVTDENFPALIDSSRRLILGASTQNIGDVDVLTLPALPAGTNNIGDVDVASIAAGTNEIGRVGAKQFNGVLKDDSGDDVTVKVAHLDMTTATTTTIVTGVALKKIRVLEYSIDSNEPATATIVNFARGASTTRVTGSPLHRLNADKPFVERNSSDGRFLMETAAGENLRVTQDAAADISVAVVYIEVD